uniref:Uncharacterized protein n=1 Tax=Alexandrium catenella TaxID=2925 RepID=A0A7S1MF69_ALECA|mmetsp:Transcript_25628/g.69819  ORF Transcript_25628/g.69819 Transcript_25628/m.69819 type:complete len:260 (+) Transcript_25628:30-809(+)|eukprot:CAMPEP_0171204898 /NCGR_PEP_ID=MMETSP0790-20130122/26274_1 /TAXON_ID=2925 /ORGANISM="Alexandrium catenella, Strain OF101" /LENGTH=259 /DNA_ID=CAMNT_0011670405 /DNA_START=30 /DNA_END=809 /DNA_ORIENTATION=+
MNRGGGPTSFNRIFGGEDGGAGGDKPSVHELFAAAMRDEMSLPHFAQALVSMHGVRMTPSAARLLSSVDAASGRLSFAQFQKALTEDIGDDPGQAGRPNVFQDQAKAIIEDNLGAPSAPSTAVPVKHSTDISADSFVRQRHRVEQFQAQGPFSANPVRKTNTASAGNPLAAGPAEEQSRGEPEDTYGYRAMANTATRMFVAGELDRPGYEKFLRRFGVQLTPECELQRLVIRQASTGDCKFTDLSRALQRELARLEPGG